ncbi:MAG: prepilin-type N-terminal cleavage/methylation domain-containing protein [Phycisphaerae bacterium]|nr:prepilin-type N-terminal cleavage/methylation domain-containing protein [Phycisphaerae bacterium]
MTMPLTGKKRNRAGPGPRAAAGFTIVELMVVLLIMMLLLAVLAPTVQKIHRTIMRVTALTTVRLIEGGCKAYYDDFNNQYPPSTHVDYVGWSGSELLVLFLTGYGPDPGPGEQPDGTPGADLSADDGCEGYGRRVEKRGRRFGPYNGTERVKTKRVKREDETYKPPVFVDCFDEEIYYYRYDPLLPGYHTTHNPAPPGLDEAGAYSDYLTQAKDMRTGFILMTAGPDGLFKDYDAHPDTDDITNFLEEQ